VENHDVDNTFYRAMHYSAKHGIEIACRLSVRPSVCDVNGSGLHRLEILKTNRSSVPKCHPPTHRGIWGDLGESRCSGEKLACWSTKAAISLQRV